MKRIIGTLLAICMVFTLCLPAMAKVGMDNYKPINTYDNNFADVALSHWAMPSIKACYEYALMYGSSDTTFSPNGELTIAEALVMADRVHRIYRIGETAVFTGDDPWYFRYVEYAVNNGLIARTDFPDVTKKATRAQMAYIFHNALSAEEFTAINSIRYIPDVSVSNPYHHEILKLYNAGILTGSDSRGTFYPDNNITRAEAAAIISRVIDVSLRKEFTPEDIIPTDSKLTASQISQKYSTSVACVELYDENNVKYGNGSGFFIDSEGLFITNYHVIEDAHSAKIIMADGKEYDVKGVYDCDKARDIALLKVDGSGFAYLEPDTSALMTGQTVYAIGSPYGLSNTISDGIISNADRKLNDLDYIQISAPISPGSSGGALINEYGKVIGITCAGITDGENLNLAVPIKYINNLEKGLLIDISKAHSIVAKKYSVTISKNKTSVFSGGKTTVIVNYVPGSRDILMMRTSAPEYIDLDWGKVIEPGKIELIIHGLYKGEGTVFVYYNDKNITCYDTMYVDVGGFEYMTKYNYFSYSNGAPTYHGYSIEKCIGSYFLDTGKLIGNYSPNADYYAYAYTDIESVTKYRNRLENKGWTFDDSKTKDKYNLYYYSMDENTVVVVVDTKEEVFYIGINQGEII